MKTKIKRMSKRTLAMLLGVLMLVTSIGIGSLITVNADDETKKIYINTAKWGDNESTVAYYAWAWETGKDGLWYDFTLESDHYYSITVPKAVSNYAFFRAKNDMSHGWTENTNYWNKTGDVAGADPKNLYTFSRYSTGTWSRYPNVAGITGITGDWTYPIDMTFDSGTQYHYTVTGDNTTKEFRFYYNGNYYQSYENAFNLETQGEYKPYDGSSNNKKYGAKTGNSNSFALTMTSGYDYTIYFDNGKVWFNKVSNEPTHTVTISAGAGGSVDPKGEQTVGESNTTTVTATPNPGYSFSNWSVTGGVSGINNGDTTNPATITATADGTLVASFTPVTYTGITYSAAYSTTGAEDSYTNALDSATTGNDSGTNVDGVDINASKEGYTFYKWEVTGGTLVSAATTANNTFKPTANDATVKALFKKNYSITTSVSGTGGTLTTNKASAVAGESYEITAAPSNGKLLKTLTLNGSSVTATNNVYSGTASGTDSTLAFAATFGNSIEINATKVGGGSGTVKIDSSTAGATASKTVVDGTDVTFTATAASGSTFIGWYDSADCTNRVSENATYTVNNVQSATSLYAAFNKSNYYLVGKFFLADMAQQKDVNYNDTTYHFTQDSENPLIYTYTNDFAFKYNTSEGSDKLQYVTVGYGDSAAYNTSSGNAVSGTAASGTSSASNSKKWTCGDAETATYPTTKLNNCYKKVTFTWNAMTKTLSWTTTDVDLSDYTALYINGGTYHYDYLYIGHTTGGDDTPLTNWPGLDLIKTPYIIDPSDGTTVYNVVLVANSHFDNENARLNAIISDGKTNTSERNTINGIEEGGSYKIEKKEKGTTIPEPETYSPESYTVSVTTTTNSHGTDAVSSHASAGRGATITITTNQSEGYVAYVTATDASSNKVFVTRASATSYTFTMPAANVNVNVEYVDNTTHSILTYPSDPELGMITTKNSGATEITASATGEMVSITLTELPMGSYKADSLRVSYKIGETTYFLPLSGSDKSFTFLMPPQSVKVTATFEEYDELANYWYDGYDTSHTKTIDTKQFRETKYNGLPYAYYKVTRAKGASSSDDHVFGVKAAADATPGSGSGKYFYVQSGYPTNGAHGWDGDMSISFQVSGSWTDFSSMSLQSSNANQKEWRYQVPSGATGVKVKCTGTSEVNMSTWLNNGAAKVNESGVANPWNPNYGDKYDGTDSAVVGSGKYYTWNVDSAYYDGNSGTAYGSDIRVYSHGSSPSYAHTGYTYTDYYIIVLYAGNNYGLLWEDAGVGNEANLSSSATVKIIASQYLPGVRPVTVDITAKDGAIRNHDSYGPYITLAKHGDTAISTTITRGSTTETISVTDHPYTSTSGNEGQTTAADQDYQTTQVKAGDIITVTTTIPSDLRSSYYVKGFVVNGVTPKTYNWRSDGVYTLEYTVTGKERNRKVEITPVYYLKDDSNTINFSIEAFTDDLKFDSSTGAAKWGDTLYVYPFYDGVRGSDNAFGAYPGQPLLFDGGKYYIQVPTSVDGNTVTGVTMSNGYWDHVHRSIMGWADNHNELHRQTYDYDDFYKIKNEIAPSNIIFEFKYRTTKQNRNDSTEYTTVSALTSAFGTSGNGFDDLEDYYGRKIDVFGNVLSDAEASNAPVYVVSKGYSVTNAGNYATLWDVYYPDSGTSTTNVTKAGSINPAALVLTESGHFAGYNNAKFSGYQAVYDVLNSNSTAKKHPVKISFESEIKIDSDDIAERSDGQWYHTNNNDIITANTQVEIQQADGSYVVDAFATDQNYGEETGCKAYFTNEEKNKDGNSFYGKTTSGQIYSNNKKNFTFEAVANGEYEFVCWKRLSKGIYYDIEGDAQSPMTANDTYVARFRKVKTGTLTVNHTLLPITGYMGSGKTYVKLDVLSTSGGTEEYSTGWIENTAKLTGTYLKYNSTKYVKVNLKTVPDGEDTFHEFTADSSVTALNTSLGDTRFFPANPTGVRNEGKTYFKSFEFQIKSGLFNDGEETVTSSLSYYSNLNKMTYKYAIKYKFDGRQFSDDTHHQWYVAKGDFSADEVERLVKYDDSYKIPADIISDKKPYERDFMRDITWDFDTAANTKATLKTGDAVKTLSIEVDEMATTADTRRTAIFKLPYCYNPNNDYNVYEWIPIEHTELRQNAQGGSYVYKTGTYYFDYPEEHTEYEYNSEVDLTPVSRKQSWVPAVTEVDGKNIPNYDNTGSVPTFKITTQYGKRFTLDAVYNESDDESTYIEATPAVYVAAHDDVAAAVKYFSYWKISSQKTNKEVARCYNKKFNFSCYEDYFVEPIYEASAAGENISNANSEALGSSITYLDSSRNQWNDNGKGTATQYAGDVLFKDFALTYKYNSVVLNDYTDKDVRVGMAVEMLGPLDTQAGSTNKITRSSYYEDKYSDTDASSQAELEYRLKNGSKNDGSKKLNLLKIASNVDGDTGYGSMSDSSLIDNKNRLKYHYAVYNSYQNTSESANTQVAYRTAAYRAYSYIMVKEKGAAWSTANVAISAEPVYFVFEDIASK